MSDLPSLPQGDFNMPPGVQASDIPGNAPCPDCEKWEEQCHQCAMECDRLKVFARLVEPYVANTYCHGKDDLSLKLYQACVEIRSLIYRFESLICVCCGGSTTFVETSTRKVNPGKCGYCNGNLIPIQKG